MLTFMAIVSAVFLIGAAAAYPITGFRSFIPAGILVVLTFVGYLAGFGWSF